MVRSGSSKLGEIMARIKGLGSGSVSGKVSIVEHHGVPKTSNSSKHRVDPSGNTQLQEFIHQAGLRNICSSTSTHGRRVDGLRHHLKAALRAGRSRLVGFDGSHKVVAENCVNSRPRPPGKEGRAGILVGGASWWLVVRLGGKGIALDRRQQQGISAVRRPSWRSRLYSISCMATQLATFVGQYNGKGK